MITSPGPTTTGPAAAAPPQAERLADAGGLRVRCLVAGEGRPVILLHGWPTSSFLWRGVVPALAARARVIAPDLPGFGGSDRPADAAYGLDQQAHRLGVVLDALGVGEAALAVHDLGGPIGLLWAVRHPGRVARLVVLNTLLYPDGLAARLYMGDGAFAARAREVLALPVPLLLKLTALSGHVPLLRALVFRPLGVRVTLRLGTERPLAAGVAARYASAYRSPEGRHALARTFLDPRRSELEEIVAGLHRLRAPTLVACGTRDRLLPGVRGELGRLAADLPDARLALVPGAGHFVPEDAPGPLAALLLEHLGSWLR